MPYKIIGQPEGQYVLIVADHASNAVPPDVDLEISPEYLNDHIAVDIGTTAIACQIAELPSYCAFLARYSRLVVDLNRYRDEDGVIPQISDGIKIPGNLLNEMQREDRLSCYFDPYHQKLADFISSNRPALIISLHSFCPSLRSAPGVHRPWHMGIMYNEQDLAAKLALEALSREDLVVGDQKPYSGKLLNATMNRHAEALNIPYFMVEIRQDLIANETGQSKFTKILLRTSDYVLSGLA